MAERPCNECIWHTADGCTSWDCEPVTRSEARRRLLPHKWNKVEDGIYICPVCKHASAKFNYCHNCGAKLEGL